MNFHEVSREEAEQLHPLVNFDGIRCIMFEPDGGNVDPSGVTNAYATGARQRGAEIYRFTPVTATEQQPDGSWIVRTPKGDIQTEWVINAAGLWGREVAALARLKLPCSRQNTNISSQKPLQKLTAWIDVCPRLRIVMGNITCAKRAKGYWWAPANAR